MKHVLQISSSGKFINTYVFNIKTICGFLPFECLRSCAEVEAIMQEFRACVCISTSDLGISETNDRGGTWAVNLSCFFPFKITISELLNYPSNWHIQFLIGFLLIYFLTIPLYFKQPYQPETLKTRVIPLGKECSLIPYNIAFHYTTILILIRNLNRDTMSLPIIVKSILT